MPEDATPSLAEAASYAVAAGAFAVLLALVPRFTPVPLAVCVALILLVVAWGIAPATHRAAGAASATVVRGVGAVAATAWVFPRLGENLPAVQLPLVVFLAGATILQADARRDRPAAAVATVGALLALVGLGLAWRAADAFPDPARLRFALGLGAALLLAGLAVRAWMRRRAPALAPLPAGVCAAALLVSVYLAYRPVASREVENLPLYEWALAAGVAGLVLGRIRRLAWQSHAPEPWSSDARRHAQDVRPIYDPRMAPLAGVLQRYLETGHGFDEYRAVLERANDAPLPPHLLNALAAARTPPRVAMARARREAAAKRLAAHEAALAHLDSKPNRRGPNDHGSPPRPMRPDP